MRECNNFNGKNGADIDCSILEDAELSGDEGLVERMRENCGTDDCPYYEDGHLEFTDHDVDRGVEDD